MTTRITYTLNDAGRKALLIAGGDGKAEQTVTIQIEPADLDLMTLAADGSLNADVRRGGVLSGSTWERYRTHEFDRVPSAQDLIDFLRARVALRTQAEADLVASQAEANAKQAE